MEKPDRLAEMCLQIGMQVDEQLSLLLGQPSDEALASVQQLMHKKVSSENVSKHAW